PRARALLAVHDGSRPRGRERGPHRGARAFGADPPGAVLSPLRDGDGGRGIALQQPLPALEAAREDGGIAFADGAVFGPRRGHHLRAPGWAAARRVLLVVGGAFGRAANGGHALLRRRLSRTASFHGLGKGGRSRHPQPRSERWGRAR